MSEAALRSRAITLPPSAMCWRGWLAGSPSSPAAREHHSMWCSKEWVGHTAAATGGDQGIAQQAGDRHRPDPARHRGDRAGDRAHRSKIDVADNAAAAVGQRQRAYSGIDNGSAGLDPVGLDHFWSTDSYD